MSHSLGGRTNELSSGTIRPDGTAFVLAAFGARRGGSLSGVAASTFRVSYTSSFGARRGGNTPDLTGVSGLCVLCSPPVDDVGSVSKPTVLPPLSVSTVSGSTLKLIVYESQDKYKSFMTYAEQLTTLFVLGGITTNATMGDPIEAALMWRFKSTWVMGWAMSRLTDAAWALIGDQRSLISPDRCAE